MSRSRLSLAVEQQGLALPADGRIAVFAARAEADLSALPRDRCDVIQPFKPDHDALSAAGFHCVLNAAGPYALAIVFLPRSKALARDLIARAAAVAPTLVVDGQKTDGVDSVLKELRKVCAVANVVSKSHGKLFWFAPGDLSAWRAPQETVLENGLITTAGVFSSDGVDPASCALTCALPAKIGRCVADLGAGWGYLSAELLKRGDIRELHLVEADHLALDCARKNIQDERAQFHWQDATRWAPKTRFDAVVMNPPFHTGRKAEPALGAQFIQTAARILAPHGKLWMVANRHLPYETTLQELFQQVAEIAGDNRFKVIEAHRPARKRR